MSESLYIDPSTIPTVRKVGGNWVEITDDVQNVARDLHAIDPRFRLRADFDDHGRVAFIVELHTPMRDGSMEEHFVGAYRELDQRIVKDAHQYTRPDYDLAAELEKVDRRRDREHDSRMREKDARTAEHLGYALRKDLGLKDRAFIARKP